MLFTSGWWGGGDLRNIHNNNSLQNNRYTWYLSGSIFSLDLLNFQFDSILDTNPVR